MVTTLAAIRQQQFLCPFWLFACTIYSHKSAIIFVYYTNYLCRESFARLKDKQNKILQFLLCKRGSEFSAENLRINLTEYSYSHPVNSPQSLYFCAYLPKSRSVSLSSLFAKRKKISLCVLTSSRRPDFDSLDRSLQLELGKN